MEKVTDEVDTKTVSYYKTEYLLTPFPAFSFETRGTKEKAWQKENADKGEFRSCGSDQGSAFGIRKLLKKFDQNF